MVRRSKEARDSAEPGLPHAGVDRVDESRSTSLTFVKRGFIPRGAAADERRREMGTARLNVWVTEIAKACRIEQPFFYPTHGRLSKSYVHVLHCDGTILEWCGTKYRDLETDCGHVEIEVPPGCYMVCATLGPAEASTKAPKAKPKPEGGRPSSLGNHISHVAVVRVDCDDHACVTLFQPDMHFCGVWWLTALKHQLDVGLEVDKGAIRAIEGVLEALPQNPLTKNMMALSEEPQPRRTKG
jgi:hypothetical protein